MKKLSILFATICISISSFAQDNLVNSLKDNKSEKAKEKFKFTDVKDLEDSPVKNQGSSGTCWSYSGNSFLESEMLRMGKPFVDISEIFTARCAYIERAKNYVACMAELVGAMVQSCMTYWKFIKNMEQCHMINILD